MKKILFFLMFSQLAIAVSFATNSIQALIDAAGPGQTVQVPNGTYTGDIVLNKKIALIGIGRPVLVGSGKGSVVTVTADGCVIQGFVIRKSGDDLQNEDSGILLKSKNNRVEGNELKDILFGIYLYHSSGNSILNNSVFGRPELEQGERGSGIHIWDSPSNRIEGNTVSTARDGLFIQYSKDNYITQNRISDLRYGVHYMFSDANTFVRNVFTNNVAGAAIMYSKNIRFRQNLFLHNRGYSSFGILLQECEHCDAEENWIVDNVTGVFAEALRDSVFRRNVIAENDVAIEMFSSASGNVFAANHFVDNLSPIQLIGRKTNTRWEENGKGNFWSDYDGYDLDENGIGDVANRLQNVFEYMENNHPRLRLYLYSPAATAIAAAEKAFPIVASSDEIDSHPLTRVRLMELPSELKSKPASVSASLGLFSLSITAISGLVFWRRGR
jgi:nitrous oxidase accessory protein